MFYHSMKSKKSTGVPKIATPMALPYVPPFRILGLRDFLPRLILSLRFMTLHQFYFSRNIFGAFLTRNYSAKKNGASYKNT